MSDVDNDHAYQAGYEAVMRAAAGQTDIMTTIRAQEQQPVQLGDRRGRRLMSVADQTKVVTENLINRRPEWRHRRVHRLRGAAAGPDPGGRDHGHPGLPGLPETLHRAKLERYVREK